MKKPETQDEVTINRGKWTWRIRPDLVGKLDLIEKKILYNKDKRGVRTVKVTGGRRAIWTTPLPAAGVTTAFIKHYSRPRLTKQLKHLARNSRTRQEWEMGLKLESMGLPVARHLAMAERKVLGLIQEDYLVQEALENFQNFDAWFSEHFEDIKTVPEENKKQASIERLATLIRNLHDRGVIQRDFKPDSIMVGPNGDLKMVDLERVHILSKSGGLALPRRLENLAKVDQTFGFIGSASDRVRFLQLYFRGLMEDDLKNYITAISRLSEGKFRKQARERRVWASTENVTYMHYTRQGFQVSAHRSLTRPFLNSVIKRIDKIHDEILECPGKDGRPGQKLKAVWCDAATALAHTPSLYYRRTPFVPARAAIHPASSSWGLLLYVAPDPPLKTWRQGAIDSASPGSGKKFAEDLGKVLAILHRTGITWKKYQADTMLYDPSFPDPLGRFYVNRLDHLILDRTPDSEAADRILAEVQALLELAPPLAETMRTCYDQCSARWFRASDRW